MTTQLTTTSPSTTEKAVRYYAYYKAFIAEFPTWHEVGKGGYEDAARAWNEGYSYDWNGISQVVAVCDGVVVETARSRDAHMIGKPLPTAE